MHVDDLFNHALTSLPEAVGDLLRSGRDPGEMVFASFDGASDLGVTLIASDLASETGLDAPAARGEVERLLLAAGTRGEELVVSMMVSREVLARIMLVSNVDTQTRLAMHMWLDGPVGPGYRVVAIAGTSVRAGVVDNVEDIDDMPVPSTSMLN